MPSIASRRPRAPEVAPRVGAALRSTPNLDRALFEYGLAWHTPQDLGRAFAAASGDTVRLVSHHPRAWDDHHDVPAFQRAG